jgi:hypothetical protein
MFNLQIRLKLAVTQREELIVTKLISLLLNEENSKVKRIFLLTPPPISHPGSKLAIYDCIDELQSLSAAYERVELLNYNQICEKLHHDKSGHLMLDGREEFFRRIVIFIESKTN